MRFNLKLWGAIFLSLTICHQLFGQDTFDVKDAKNRDVLEFQILQTFRPFVTDELKGKKLYHYFTYTIRNKKGLHINPENLKPGDKLTQDVYTVTGVLKDNEYVENVDGEVKIEEEDKEQDLLVKRKHIKEPRALPLAIAGIRHQVRLFVKGHVLDEKDIRLLRRVPYKALIVDDKRLNVISMNLNTTLPLDVIDFQGNEVLKKGITLNARNLAILRQLPIGPIYVERDVNVNLDIKVFHDFTKTMKCVAGCEEVYSIENAYPGTPFKCGDLPDNLAKLGIMRITKDSIYNGNDGVLGCGNQIYVSVRECNPLQDHIVIDKIWDSEPKKCQFCQTVFEPKDIRKYHLAKLKHPTSGEFYEEKIERFAPDAKVALGSESFNLSEIKEMIPEEIECPACGKWLRQDLNYLDLNLHPIKKIQAGAYYNNLQKLPYDHIRRGIAVFDNISDHADKIEIVVGGLDEDLYEKLEGGDYRRILSKHMAKFPDSSRYIRKLVLTYQHLGDEYETSKDPYQLVETKWKYFKQDVLSNRTLEDAYKAKIRQQ